MPFYMIQAAYTAEAAAIMTNKPQDRAAGVRALTEKLGGKMHNIYFSMGEYDVVVISELPDDISAAASAVAASSPGHLRAYKTTKLLTPDEFMSAQKKAGGLAYSGPSK